MKFNRLQLRGLYDIQLPIMGAQPSDKYVLKAADGLGPPEVDVAISRSRSGRGVYQGRQPLDRELTLRIGLQPNYNIGQTAADLRTEIYGLLTPPWHSDFVTVFIIDESQPIDSQTVAITTAWVKRCEIVPFSKDPEVQVTLSCLDPYLEATNTLTSVTAANRTPITFTNGGTAPSGLLVNVNFTGPQAFFQFKDSLGGVIMRLNHSFVANDQLTIDSRPGYHKIDVFNTVAFQTTNLSHALTPTSQWLTARGGDNYLAGEATTTNWSWGAVQYRKLYWGI